MKRLIYRYLPILLVVVIGLSLPISQVAADDTCNTYDFSTGEHGFVLITTPGGSDPSVGSYSGSEYDTGYVSVSGFDEQRVHIYLDFGATWTLTSIQVFYSVDVEDAVRAPAQIIISGNGDSPQEYDISSGSGQNHTFDGGGGTGDRLDVSLLAEAGFDPGPQGSGSISKVIICGTLPSGEPTLTMPLASADLHPTWGMYDSTYVHSLDDTWSDDDGREPVDAYSNKLNVHVHAVAAGTVTAVDPDITSQCVPMDEVSPEIPFAPHACFVIIPAVIAEEDVAQVFTVQMTNTSLVLVQDDSDSTIIYTYFISNATVSVGDHLDAGCVLGETIPLNNAPIHLGDIGVGLAIGNSGATATAAITGGLNSIYTGKSVVVVRQDKLVPEITRLYPNLTAEPDESTCGTGSFGGCINANSSLLSLDSWSATEGVDLIPGGGVTLPGGTTSTQIYQTGITVVDATNYTLNVQARSTQAGDGFTVVPKIRLFVGTQISEQAITTTWANYSFDFLGEDLTPEQAIGIVNRNASGTDLEVRYVCLSVQGAPQARSSCYFNNHHFDDGPTDWEVGGGVTFDTGQAFTHNDSTIAQTVILNPLDGETPATYNLTVAGRLIATNGFTGQEDKTVTLQYLYPSDGSYSDIGTVDSVLVDSEGKNVYDGSVNLEHPYVLTVPFDVSEHTNSTFTIKTLVTDSENFLTGFRIDYACLQSTTDDGSFPGQDPPGGFEPPFVESCEAITVPQDNNISSWIYFHWANLNRFFDCTLMVKLNHFADTMDTTAKTMKWFMRWVIDTGQMGGRWMSTQLFPWLNGQFRNMAIGQVTTVYQSGGSCNDIFCVLNTLISGILTPINNIVNTVLGLINAAANLLLTILTGVIGLGLAFLGRLFGLFNQVTGLFTGIIGAYTTATPATISGLPTCGIDPTSSPFCRATWVLDNTIFGGRWAVLLTLILGIASIHLILWVIGEFKAAIISTGSSS